MQEYSRVALTEMDKLLTKLINALNDLDELYKETVTELTENLKGTLTGKDDLKACRNCQTNDPMFSHWSVIFILISQFIIDVRILSLHSYNLVGFISFSHIYFQECV